MKYIIFFTCLLSASIIRSQSSACSWAPMPVQNMEQAHAYIFKNPHAGADVVMLTDTRDTTNNDREIYRYENGDVFTMNGYTYKVLSVLSTKQYNVAYVFLNGENLSQKEIASLEKRIIREYKNGTPFAELIKTYTMDGDPDMEADLWFSENQRLPEFIAAVEKQKPGDVYTLDIPGHKFHYVIKATAPPRISHTYAVFRMPQPLPKNSYSSN